MQLIDLKGIGKKTAEKLELLGITHVNDLLFHLPLRYQDKTRVSKIINLSFGQTALVEGEIIRSYLNNARKPMLICEISDGTQTLALKFFNHFYSQRVKMQQGKTFVLLESSVTEKICRKCCILNTGTLKTKICHWRNH